MSMLIVDDAATNHLNELALAECLELVNVSAQVLKFFKDMV